MKIKHYSGFSHPISNALKFLTRKIYLPKKILPTSTEFFLLKHCNVLMIELMFSAFLKHNKDNAKTFDHFHY